ncbi:ankyrin repeat domain-containing protein [Paenibacillus sp. JDR-2]|uniref:ankyrin repeat domain-containing protein n=1 Tax=Paenibacillus sp. (strain JDR-2) TaxID=324057 RepID=UPI000166BC20|nr:ankyrin repeat domain-containing protein [Paenibacillus sp. JDR-2]ACT01918.1 Ankyrin [Paenibacillus sp. JDR-2]
MTDKKNHLVISDDELDKSIIEQFKQGVSGYDPEAVERLLQLHPLLAVKIDEPWFAFDAPAIVSAANRGDRKMVDVLLEYGANINAKSSWWAGGFGVLHHDHYDLSRYLIDKGAIVDPHAAAALGKLDALRKMVEEEPDIVNLRGPDGQVPLHYAGSPEIIDFLLSHGADIDRRDLDHNGTPAQYAVNNLERCRHLVQRGAQTDIFMACKLGDINLVRRMLKEDPNLLQVQVGKGDFTAPGGHIYEYNIGGAMRPLFFAERLGHEEITELMLSYSSVEQRLLLACMRADRRAVDSLLMEYPGIVQSLQPEEQGFIADAAWNNQTDAVQLMLEVGFHVDARRSERSATALHHAAGQGNDKIVQLLIDHGASVDVLNEFGGTPLNSCIWGSLHILNPDGNYAEVAENLVQAGAKLPNQAAGSEHVKQVLFRHGASY